MKKLFTLGAGLTALFAAANAETFPSTLETTSEWTSITGDFRVAPESKALEKVMGAPDFVKVRDLAKTDPNLTLSRKVGQFLYIPEGDSKKSSVCSGSLVGPALFLTNHHCIVGEAGGTISVADVYIAMEHVSEDDFGPKGSVAGLTRIVASSAKLDYALLELSAPLGEKYGWLELERDPAATARERAVKIIQHPAGRSKEIVTSNTAVVQVQNPWVHYLADTEGGSSGSPVFALNGEKIIALHHAGVKNKYNEGVVISFIANEIARYLPVATATANTARTQQAPAQTSNVQQTPAQQVPAQQAPAQQQPATQQPPATTPATRSATTTNADAPSDQDSGWVAVTGQPQ